MEDESSRNPLENDSTALVVLPADNTSFSLTRFSRFSRWLAVFTDFQTGLTEKRRTN